VGRNIFHTMMAVYGKKLDIKKYLEVEK